MEIMFEIFNNTPGLYFVGGLALGYLLRGAATKGEKNSRGGRYHSARSASDVKKPVPARFTMKEPSFDWMVRTPGKASAEHVSVALDQPASEI